MENSRELTPVDYAKGCLRHIANDPKSYDQKTWQTVDEDAVAGLPKNNKGQVEVSCQTTGCVAGTVSIMAGDVGLMYPNESLRTIRGKSVYAINEVLTKAGQKRYISERGRELLRLTESEATWLFSSDRQLSEVINALLEIIDGGRITRKNLEAMTDEEADRLEAYKYKSPVVRKHLPRKAAAKNAPVRAVVE